MADAEERKEKEKKTRKCMGLVVPFLGLLAKTFSEEAEAGILED